MRSTLSLLLPGFVLALVTLVAALPWGGPVVLKSAMPLLPYVVAHFWVVRRNRAMPDWLVSLAGLATDILGQGPLGYWSLVYLAGFAITRLSTSRVRPDWPASIGLYGMTVAVLVPLQWIMISLYTLQAADLVPLVVAAVATTMVYAVLVLLVPVQGENERRFNDRLERGA